MPKEQFIRTLRSLAECYQAFEAYSRAHVRKLGLTVTLIAFLISLVISDIARRLRRREERAARKSQG